MLISFQRSLSAGGLPTDRPDRPEWLFATATKAAQQCGPLVQELHSCIGMPIAVLCCFCCVHGRGVCQFVCAVAHPIGWAVDPLLLLGVASPSCPARRNAPAAGLVQPSSGAGPRGAGGGRQRPPRRAPPAPAGLWRRPGALAALCRRSHPVRAAVRRPWRAALLFVAPCPAAAHPALPPHTTRHPPHSFCRICRYAPLRGASLALPGDDGEPLAASHGASTLDLLFQSQQWQARSQLPSSASAFACRCGPLISSLNPWGTRGSMP